MSNFPMPRNLSEDADGRADDEQRAWMAALPGIVAELAERWSLTLGPPFQPGGQTAWVAPATAGTSGDLVLKVARRHTEATHEADGLREWNGHGTVRLYASADLDDTIGLLLERCIPGNSLAELPETEQDVVIASLLRRLWREPPPVHPFRPLQDMCDQWADEFEHKAAARRGILDRGLAREGIELFRTLPRTAERHVLLCTDLHAGNVLSAQRDAWLIIDPKPYVGDPTYDALQHMLNCEQRLQADARSLALRMADLLGLDGDRLLLWLFARCVQESLDWPPHAEVARRLAPSS